MTAVAATAATLKDPASFSPSGADHVLLYCPVSLLKYSSYAPFCTAYLHAHYRQITPSTCAVWMSLQIPLELRSKSHMKKHT